ncbi:MAG: ATP-grasp domain-containing protein, partial [Victivallales bacterium]|nr:ATP-grasp domain-containing protein [Victivallales bacterium]
SNAKVKKFVETYGFPLIIKPDIGVGAQHTCKVKTYEQLNENLANMPSGLILEQFVEGTIVTYDGLANIHGEVMFASSMELSNSIMDVVNNRGPVHYIYQKNLNPELEDFGQRLVKAFNVKERFFHFEFFRTPEGNHKALEVNIRPPGGYCMDMLNYMCDIDLYKDWADLVVNDEQYITFNRKYNVGCVARRDRFNYVHNHKEIMHKYGKHMALHLEMPKVFSTAMGDYIYIIRHPELKYLKEAIAFIEKTK